MLAWLLLPLATLRADVTVHVSGNFPGHEELGGRRESPLSHDISDLGPSAGGKDLTSSVGNDDRTRWEAVKQVLRDLFGGYVGKDLGLVREQFSPDLVQDLQVIVNAITEDYQTQTNFNVDIELLEFRRSLSTFVVRFLWNRNAVDSRTGLNIVHSGECSFQFDRQHGFRIRQMQGPVPFGLFNQQLRAQLQLGQPNFEVRTLVGPEPPPPPPMGGPPPPPPPPPAGTFGVLDLTSLTTTTNAAALDIEAGTAAFFADTLAGRFTAPARPPGATEDVYVWVQAFVPGSSLFVQRVNTARAGPCAQGVATLITDMRRLNVGGLGTSILDNGTLGANPLFAINTVESNFAFLRLGPFGTTGSAVNDTVRNTVVLVNPPGTQDCP